MFEPAKKKVKSKGNQKEVVNIAAVAPDVQIEDETNDHKPDDISSSSSSSSSDIRVQIVKNNNAIAACAKNKDLAGAVEKYQLAVTSGWANQHTYCAIMNAYIRCGDVPGAHRVFVGMKASKIRLDVVACTTMMKGYSSHGDVGRCWDLLEAMERPANHVQPNIRTVNTFLRGCVLSGCVQDSETMITKMQRDYKLVPDISSWEYAITLMCSGLRLDRALPAVGRILKNHSSASSMQVS